jgi:hypothetical protein
MKITTGLAEALVRSLIFSGGNEEILITGSIAIGATKGIDPSDIDFVCHFPHFEPLRGSWEESPYFVGQGYKKVIDGVSFNAIAVTSIGAFQAWRIATKALYNPNKEWPSKSQRIAAFNPILTAALEVLCQ